MSVGKYLLSELAMSVDSQFSNVSDGLCGSICLERLEVIKSDFSLVHFMDPVLWLRSIALVTLP